MQRYVSSSLTKPEVSLDDVHHILRVMRQRKGDFFEVLFDEKIYKMEIKSIDPFIYEVVDIDSTNNEIANDITLFYCLSKGDKNDFVIQKATELGVKQIVLLNSKRSVLRLDNESFNKKRVRYERIIKEASEQSKRNIVPLIDGIYDIDKIPTSLLKDINLVAYENEKGDTKDTLKVLEGINDMSVSVLIGSEGGIAKEEMDFLLKQNFVPISLGKRILRTETAAVYALSVIAFILESKK